jgi:hypothetical protein
MIGMTGPPIRHTASADTLSRRFRWSGSDALPGHFAKFPLVMFITAPYKARRSSVLEHFEEAHQFSVQAEVDAPLHQRRAVPLPEPQGAGIATRAVR